MSNDLSAGPDATISEFANPKRQLADARIAPQSQRVASVMDVRAPVLSEKTKLEHRTKNVERQRSAR
jgi:hypothetical protein